MKKEITGHWIKMHDEKFQELYYYSRDQIKEDEMGWARGTCEGRKRCTRYWWRNLKDRDHLQDL